VRIVVRELGAGIRAGLVARLYAHARPIYVTVDGAGVSRPNDAAYFVEWIDRLIEMCETKGVYSSDADRASVVALFREGQTYYREHAG